MTALKRSLNSFGAVLGVIGAAFCIRGCSDHHGSYAGLNRSGQAGKEFDVHF
ncbi:hypothetical protein [Ketogulonicigenium vulgare]|uniref:Uncharacterized protein n=1 Tax=Ketogulonicigenium vulgare (strain WSH-001) TaxID=759362 RepID=F9Y3A1_KETVW|nr:hypothetical protein [Ketogulonicigenium vulgare]ADO42139.1 hypothetical protein EIO_0991 [Ketogulonicigenium vulgare Y25]AEM40342.1 hypothetical protein KVU_0503 [Ketogulonicigenium vulgare WSH-001]ALJ80537.1 hypothetical protein KVH_04700 [Ketogulonicigenium vulgare]ANW34938.1 hypothetical protein KvSKV_04670 [Ketogulonicigenium vulgare]AOZ54055.1 hypothetical protein KVC_1038 [Ketogulonicigenium vulgare]